MTCSSDSEELSVSEGVTHSEASAGRIGGPPPLSRIPDKPRARTGAISIHGLSVPPAIFKDGRI